jgi:hypothetical protein
VSIAKNTMLWGVQILLAMQLSGPIGCGSFAGNPEEEEQVAPKSEAEIPDVTRINLTNLGKADAALKLRGMGEYPSRKNQFSVFELLANEGKTGCGQQDLGLFGISIDAACTLSAISSNLLYGENPDRDGDGKLTCGDYRSGEEDLGFLTPLLCEPAVLATKNIRSVRFEEDGVKTAISFEKFSDDSAVIGNWTASGPETGRYPANIRAWRGTTDPQLDPVLAFALESIGLGTNYFDLRPLNESLVGEVAFSIPVSPEKCKSEPSKENCFWQDIQILITDAEKALSGSSPSGIHLVIFADNKQNPTFVAIEGKYRYDPAVAKKILDAAEPGPSLFKNTIEIYFRTVQVNEQLWGSFDFKDSEGKTVAMDILDDKGKLISLTELMRNGPGGEAYGGICQNLSSKDLAECSRINYKDYAAVWRGDENLQRVEANYRHPIAYGTAPEKVGFVTGN